MDKQELIEWIDKNKIVWKSAFGLSTTEIIDTKELIKQLEQLNEPQKVKVPAFVAEWIEICIEKADLSSCLNGYYEIGDGTIVRPRGFSEEFYDWLSDYDHMHDLARAYLDGYEVEEEPKWIVEFQNKHELPFYFDHFNGLKGKGNQYFDFAYTTKENAEQFIDKSIADSVADSVATLVNGTVEKV
ncbi:DUF1642 domain-containing protein [Enterococcus sp. DIV0800]|uniref:DUF1642 domain-containing protein n=1 Tax=unclassified Enterococcus TaxID=2608891 RepID=UPI003D2FE5F6